MKENMVERHPMKSYLKTRRSSRHGCFITSEKAKSISGQIFEMDYGIVSQNIIKINR
jgi:enoyl-[acyl-carrier-protein] reductase (NADH)